MPAATSVITLAGGCFWCLESGYSYFLFKIKVLRFVKTISDKILSSVFVYFNKILAILSKILLNKLCCFLFIYNNI